VGRDWGRSSVAVPAVKGQQICFAAYSELEKRGIKKCNVFGLGRHLLGLACARDRPDSAQMPEAVPALREGTGEGAACSGRREVGARVWQPAHGPAGGSAAQKLGQLLPPLGSHSLSFPSSFFSARLDALLGAMGRRSPCRPQPRQHDEPRCSEVTRHFCV